MYRILFLCSLFSIWNYTTLFSTFYCDCCKDCCDCCNPNVITEPDIITDEDRAITENILKHLKLDGNNLDNIVNEINTIQDNEEKIKKIIEYSKDIDWENECCPNTLIRWEKNECFIIANFDLMLNNPYFLKFFLICDKTMCRRKQNKEEEIEETYVLNAICDLVKYCVEHPRFEGGYRGSVDKIAKAFFRKEGKEYYYLKKELSFLEIQPKRQKGASLLNIYYYGLKNPTEEIGKPHIYGEFQGSNIFDCICLCLLYDLEIKGTDLEKEGIWQLFPGPADKERVNKENIAKIFSSKEEDQLPILKTHKLLGVMLYQKEWHVFSLINNNGIWYNKNTLEEEQCKEMTVQEILKLFNKILGIEKINYKDFDKYNCYFLFSKLYEVQN